MIDTEAIKTRILDFAMHGKLTEQVSEDGIAEDLYCLIQEEKKKKSKTKKNKTAVISEDEILFDIPNSWKWVHLDDIASSMLGKTLNKSTDKGENCPYLCSINVYWDGISLENVKQAKFDIASKEKYRLEKGDLLICEGGDSGRSAVWNGDEEMYYQNALHRVRFYGGINPYYFCRVFEYYKKTGIIANYTTGIGIQHLVQNSLNSIWLPLPPISEQERIVERIDEIFETLDKIDHLQNQHASNQEVLKSKLIDAAIQGKLTEQLPEDGTAEDLRKEAVKYKEELAEEGILKNRKNKDIRDITDEECLFDLPSSWSWFRLGEIIEVFGRIGFRGYKKSDLVQKGQGAITMSPSNISKSGEVSFDSSTYISWEKYEESPEIMLEEGDVVLVKTGSTYGKCGIINDLPEKATINPQLAILKYIKCNRKYLYYALRSTMAWTQYESFVVGAATPTFSQEKLSNMMIPMPPMAEQERIVSVLDQIFEEK